MRIENLKPGDKILIPPEQYQGFTKAGKAYSTGPGQRAVMQAKRRGWIVSCRAGPEGLTITRIR